MFLGNLNVRSTDSEYYSPYFVFESLFLGVCLTQVLGCSDVLNSLFSSRLIKLVSFFLRFVNSTDCSRFTGLLIRILSISLFLGDSILFYHFGNGTGNLNFGSLSAVGIE